MRKEILPEMFNYNKYPGPDFVYVADLLKSDAYQFTVLENHKDALDATRFGQRFSEIMLKYDYIVGDWSNDQLRLKGFYEDDRPNTRKTDRISRLSEYLREYCAFGCAYFILKNEDVEKARTVIDKTLGGIDKPNTGIMFGIDLTFVAGLNIE